MRISRSSLSWYLPVACLALGMGFFSPAVQSAEPVSLPVGKWRVTFTNGVVEAVEIKAYGSVSMSESSVTTKGKASVVDGFVEIRFENDRVERWSLDSATDRMTVQHWHPVSAMPKARPEIGSALRRDARGPALEVHEWGTFTVVQGSNGRVIPWYQAPDKLVDLPPFVKQSRFVGTKSWSVSGGLDTVRMETPVLYFYPEEKMDVTVRASFAEGRITEIFPPEFRPTPGGPTIWHGTLLPPESPERKMIPAATGPRGRHYGAAREVPEAWLFHNRSLLPGGKPMNSTGAGAPAVTIPVAAGREEKKEPPVEPIDHFIFYRGAGNHSFSELRAGQGNGPDTFTLTNYGKETIPKLFALRVRDGQSSWLALENLERLDWVNRKPVNQQDFTFPASMGPVSEVAADLRAAMIDSLHAEGLTRDEAAAMVATWDDLWFTEPGTRILAILPQAFADRMVPLSIAPRPTRIERVFVARVEILTREMEENLTDLLRPAADGNGDEAQIAEDAARLGDLQLGRYAAGGMERAVQLLERETRSRFARLEQALKEQEKKDAAQPEELAAAGD